ncbi:hypothetical protein GOP47_0005114 [Adiantum capillus-veneris]|uniref:Uncharacterized protein n=1 Tax=Adiantum capillus-veneris TaxID=13818 RepID=A0A9D4V4I2_ADICA|nr:hypothetical protein GOP47_0005114 [Adiantum capillus-veneris]
MELMLIIKLLSRSALARTLRCTTDAQIIIDVGITLLIREKGRGAGEGAERVIDLHRAVMKVSATTFVRFKSCAKRLHGWVLVTNDTYIQDHWQLAASSMDTTSFFMKEVPMMPPSSSCIVMLGLRLLARV